MLCKFLRICRKKNDISMPSYKPVLRVCSQFQENEGKHVFYDITIKDLKLILSYMV